MKFSGCVVVLLCFFAGTAHAKKCQDSTTFGSWLSGQAVAENPDGEDYAADSGSMVLLGCTRFLDESYRYTANLSVGYRYQLDKSGKGRNSGWSAETSLGGNWGGISLGGGALYQFEGEIRDYYGAKTKIEPGLGGFIYLGLTLSPGLELQLRRHYLSFETENGGEFDAADYGVFLHRGF